MSKYNIPNLKRACEILVFTGSSGREMSPLEISRELSIPRTTAVRILETLAEADFLARDGKKYALGPSLTKLGNITALRANIGDIAYPYLKKLTDITGETSHIGILSGDKVLIARVCESPLALHAASRAGSLVDMYCSGTGKVLLADLYSKDRNYIKKIRFQKRTKNTISSVKALQKDLEASLARGYTLDDEEYHDSIRCLAVPVKDKVGNTIAALGITAPAVRFEKRFEPKMHALVSSVAKELSARISAAS